MRKSEIREVIRGVLQEESKGLWANINAKQARGEKPARKGSKEYKAAVKAGNELETTKEVVDTVEENPKDTITIDVPLFIRLLEYAKEDAETDMDLHTVAEVVIELSGEGKVLSMEDYSKIVAKKVEDN